MTYSVKMEKELVRIGSDNFANKSELFHAFDLLFRSYHELVYISDYDPLEIVNGTWAGALGHLMNDTHRLEAVGGLVHSWYECSGAIQ